MPTAPTPAAHDELARLRFRWPWRAYQERILGSLEKHVADRKLHLVAAPGAGKTVLGLEVFRRIGAPALVLSPSRTIRDQWVRRLCDFMPEAERDRPPAWASADLKAPGILTSVTYQALHARFRDEEAADAEAAELGAPRKSDWDALVELLKKAEVGTLILDEAHHLRAEWWRALAAVHAALPELTLVCLTATPPYDVTGSEWQRYQELCGPVDEHISVPELVKGGTLCPHQDYVYAVAPLRRETERLAAHEAAAQAVVVDLLAEPMRTLLLGHEWLAADASAPEAVLGEPELAVALLVFQKAAGSRPSRFLLRLLGLRKRDLPPWGRRWAQRLVSALLAGTGWPGSTDEPLIRELRDRLKNERLRKGSDLFLAGRPPAAEALSLSPGKIEGCVAIHALEREQRGDALRQVVLTDFIRDEDFDRSQRDPAPRLGAWPLFRALVEANEGEPAARMALLTGRLVVVHADVAARIQARTRGPVRAEPMATWPGWRTLSAPTGEATRMLTEALERGDLHVLVGTRALLGEGWDAPCVNSLVLASVVGSFVQTNQMRGRAIRIDRKNPEKVASLWHLVAVPPGVPGGQADVEDLQRRFSAFAGLASEAPIIESGVERLALGGLLTASEQTANADAMQARLASRTDLADRWRAAVSAGTEGRVVPSVRTPQPPSFRSFHFKRTLHAFLVEAFFVAVAAACHSWRANSQWEGIGFALMWSFIAGGLFVLPRLLKAAWMLGRHLPVDGALKQIGCAVRDSLVAIGEIEGPVRKREVSTRNFDDGSCQITLFGASYHEQSVFADAMEEALAPIDNPRYLVTRERGIGWWKRFDYHAVPHLLATHKEKAEGFWHAWRKHVGPGRLLYTRNADGRLLLLKARARAFSSQLALPVERRDRWE